MSQKNWIIVGSGQRVREAALPVAAAVESHWHLAGVFSRSPKELSFQGPKGRERSHAVESLEGLTRERLSGVDLVYLVVSKGAVPAVLERLGSVVSANTELLIETPVLLPKHLGRRGLLQAFRAAYAAEDCAYLPLLPAIRRFVESGALGGPPRAAIFSHCAYAYHGVAMAKAFLGGGEVVSGRRTPLAGGLSVRSLNLTGGRRVHVLDPRDYSVGRVAIAGPKGVLADHSLTAKGHWPLSAEHSNGRLSALRAGDECERLDEAELTLVGSPRAGEGLWTWMDGMKRVGLLRMMRAIAAGQGGYPLSEALDDTLVDYHLEKLSRYRRNPLTSANGALSPLFWRALGLLARG